MRISASPRHNATCAPDKAHTQEQSYAGAMESHDPQAWRREHDGTEEKWVELDLEAADELPTGIVPARKLRNESGAPLFLFHEEIAPCVPTT